MALKSRQNHPPGGGFTFYQPQTKWSLRGGLPFSMAVTEIIRHRQANPALNLSTDPAVVADELDAFTCARLKYDPAWCVQKKTTAPTSSWSRPSAPPLPPVAQPAAVETATLVDRAKQVVNGLVTLGSWIGHGAKPVSQDEADRRAMVCSVCPKNIHGSLVDNVIGSVAEAIHQTVGLKNHLKMQTQQDDKLGTCDACGCHLSLKVWVPEDEIRKSLTQDILEECPSQCWMKRL